MMIMIILYHDNHYIYRNVLDLILVKVESSSYIFTESITSESLHTAVGELFLKIFRDVVAMILLPH